jgi:hypothetical protein
VKSKFLKCSPVYGELDVIQTLAQASIFPFSSFPSMRNALSADTFPVSKRLVRAEITEILTEHTLEKVSETFPFDVKLFSRLHPKIAGQANSCESRRGATTGQDRE